MVVLADNSGENEGLASLQNINILKASEYSIGVPATSMNAVFPLT